MGGSGGPGGGGGWEAELRPSDRHTHKPVHTHKYTDLMVTTWLDQNKAFRQALFSAKLVFLKQLRAKERFFLVGGGGSKTFICLPFGDWIDGKHQGHAIIRHADALLMV